MTEITAQLDGTIGVYEAVCALVTAYLGLDEGGTMAGVYPAAVRAAGGGDDVDEYLAIELAVIAGELCCDWAEADGGCGPKDVWARFIARRSPNPPGGPRD